MAQHVALQLGIEARELAGLASRPQKTRRTSLTRKWEIQVEHFLWDSTHYPKSGEIIGENNGKCTCAVEMIESRRSKANSTQGAMTAFRLCFSLESREIGRAILDSSERNRLWVSSFCVNEEALKMLGVSLVSLQDSHRRACGTLNLSP